MSKVSASILSADLANLAADSSRLLNAGADILHFDVMDGHFVPNISYGAPVLTCLKQALPNAYYDVHLMISEPARYAADFAKAGADLITFHYEAVPGRVGETIDTIRAVGCKVGISIKPGTPVEEIFDWLDKVDLVLVMSVEPGFGGQGYLEKSTERIREVRRMIKTSGRNIDLEVDGGIRLDNLKMVLDAGANIIVAGSAVFHGDIEQNVREINKILEA